MEIQKYSDNVKKDLALNVYIIRNALKFNHQYLVELSGITRPVLSSIENASSNPTIDSIIKLSNALKIKFDVLFLSETKFEKLKLLLKSQFEKERRGEFDFLISEKSWKLLMKFSGDRRKSSVKKVSKICAEILKSNFSNSHEGLISNMILGATLGVIFQEDGFKFGLEFGAWLGYKLN